MKLSNEDYHLSMKLSRRGKVDLAGDVLRSLLVHRLRVADKAVLRVPMSEDIRNVDKRQSVYCEPCALWFPVDSSGEQFNCPECSGVFVLEFAVFTRVPQTD